LRASVLELEALLAYDIDFPDEDDGPVPPERVAAAAADLERALSELLRHAPEGELLREGALTVVAGRPNAGKSSLFNALLGIERAIVTEQPGTTRDAIEALLAIEGYPFRLVDTAGIRRDAERIEEMGIEVARSYLDRADLALVCIEADRPPAEEERQFVEALAHRLGAERVLVVRTKADLAGMLSGSVRSDEQVVSAIEGEGMADLRRRMLRAVYAGLRSSDEAPLVTRRRHVRALEAARAAVTEFRVAWKTGHPPEIAATHLRDAVRHLEEVLGVVTTEDVLDTLFASFCVGK
jgi:tRNA modification GTPase